MMVTVEGLVEIVKLLQTMKNHVGKEQLLEWSLNDDGTLELLRVIEESKRDYGLLNGSILGMLLSPLGDLSHIHLSSITAI
jgi:hypothetical protein